MRGWRGLGVVPWHPCETAHHDRPRAPVGRLALRGRALERPGWGIHAGRGHHGNGSNAGCFTHAGLMHGRAHSRPLLIAGPRCGRSVASPLALRGACRGVPGAVCCLQATRLWDPRVVRAFLSPVSQDEVSFRVERRLMAAVPVPRRSWPATKARFLVWSTTAPSVCSPATFFSEPSQLLRPTPPKSGQKPHWRALLPRKTPETPWSPP